MRFFLTVTIFLFTQTLSAQFLTYYHQLNAADTSAKVLKHRFSNLEKLGYIPEIKPGMVNIYLSSVDGLSDILKRRRDQVILAFGDERIVLKRNELRNLLMEQYMKRYKDKSKKYQRKRKRYFKKVLKGKKKQPRGIEAFKLTFSVDKQAYGKKPFSIYWEKGCRRYASVDFKLTSATHFDEFPFFKNMQCKPFDRWTHFLSAPSLGIRSFGKLPYYAPLQVNRSTENFILFFDKNSFTYKQEEVQKIEDFLITSHKNISKAEITGYASVEGDSANNIKLQESRAGILMKVLEKYADVDLPYKLMAEENWKLFEFQVKKNNLPEKTTAEWKESLKNDSVQQALEPLLAVQRNAEVKLYLYERKTQNEILDDIYKTTNRFLNKYHSLPAKSPQRATALGNILAIRDYIFKKVEKKDFPLEWLLNLDEQVNIPDYYIYSLFSEILKPKNDRSHVSVMRQLTLKAYKAALYKFDQHSYNRFTQSDLLEIQKYIFKAILDGYFDAEMFFELPVPDEDKYIHLLLNHLEFKDRLIANNMLTSNDQEPTGQIISVDSRYYYLLKKIALNSLGGKFKSVSVRSDWLLEFDLAYFLHLNISNWQISERTLFDPEVNVEIMHKVLKKLDAVKSTICPYTVNYLKVGFYSKVIQNCRYKKVEPKLVTEAFDFIKSYYTKNFELMTSREKEGVAGQITGVNEYFYFNEPMGFSEILLKDLHQVNGSAFNNP